MNVLKYYLRIIVAQVIFLTANICAAPFLIVAQGATTSGTSSFCRALATQHPDWKLIIEDECWRVATLRACEERFPDEYAAVAEIIEPQNRFMALKQNIISFIPESTDEQRQRAGTAIKIIRYSFDSCPPEKKDVRVPHLKETIRADIRAHFAQGHTVIVEDFLFKDEEIDAFADVAQIIRVLTYCPFPTLIDRMFKRNEQAIEENNLWEHRWFRYMFGSFLNLYTRTQKKENALDVLNANLVKRCFENVRAYITMLPEAFFSESVETGAFCRGEYTISELAATKDKFLQQFGLDTQDQVWIEPRKQYDLIVDTGIGSPHDCVITFESYFKEIVGENS